MGGVFHGRPRGRSVDSNPSRFAVRSCQDASPNGAPPVTDRRNAASSASVSAAWMRAANPAATPPAPCPAGPRRPARDTKGSTSATPPQMRHQIRPTRVAFHIPQDRQQVIVLFDRKRLEASLVQGSRPGRVVFRVPAWVCVTVSQRTWTPRARRRRAGQSTRCQWVGITHQASKRSGRRFFASARPSSKSSWAMFSGKKTPRARLRRCRWKPGEWRRTSGWWCSSTEDRPVIRKSWPVPRDAHRATLVGETTFGTGTVLSQFPLSDGSSSLLAVQEWLTPGQTVLLAQRH